MGRTALACERRNQARGPDRWIRTARSNRNYVAYTRPKRSVRREPATNDFRLIVSVRLDNFVRGAGRKLTSLVRSGCLARSDQRFNKRLLCSFVPFSIFANGRLGRGLRCFGIGHRRSPGVASEVHLLPRLSSARGKKQSPLYRDPARTQQPQSKIRRCSSKPSSRRTSW